MTEKNRGFHNISSSIFEMLVLIFLSFKNLPWDHARSHTKFGPGRSSRFVVYYWLHSNLSPTRGFNGSVNIPESCDFQSQFDPLDMNF